jgi:L-alanine-DL-glutamate epimerase-like enolase superfamily enzyme
VLPKYGHLLRNLVDISTVPIALGERLYSRADFVAPLQSVLAESRALAMRMILLDLGPKAVL